MPSCTSVTPATAAAAIDATAQRQVDATPSGDWMDNTNCYCYALNVHKVGVCMPSGLPCGAMRETVQADEGKEVTRDEAFSGAFVARLRSAPKNHSS